MALWLLGKIALEGQPDDLKIKWLLANVDKCISYRVALFALVARNIRASFLDGASAKF